MRANAINDTVIETATNHKENTNRIHDQSQINYKHKCNTLKLISSTIKDLYIQI